MLTTETAIWCHYATGSDLMWPDGDPADNNVTHYPREKGAVFSNEYIYPEQFLWPHWSKDNTGLSNGLLLLGNKPLPEPMLTQIRDTI